jgi:hypothetical protein
MKPIRWMVVPAVLLFSMSFSVLLEAQVGKIEFPAGSPEDQALMAITNETDAQKKLAMYEDFLQKFSSNPAAVAYGNWRKPTRLRGIYRRHWRTGTRPWLGHPITWIFSRLRPGLPSR